ncbi:DUF5630 domain-containing protein [Legionella lytica]|uniref:DUF5630 domain-containing protein n=1 Tax=Legionella lytica TaxID=96232 RepID=A0ABW8D743_9GAMM
MTSVAVWASKLDLLLRNVNSDVNESAKAALIKYLNSFALRDLMNILAHNQHLREELRQPRYAAYWDEELSKVPVATAASLFSFKKQQHVSSLDFLMGYLLANELVAQDKPPAYQQFFELAKTYHSLYALHLGTQLLIRSLYQEERIAAEDLAYCEDLVRDEARYYGTPGYLLASSVAFHFMCLKINSAVGERDVLERQEILYSKDSHLYKAYFYVVMARRLKSRSESEQHNAYFGGSFADHYPLGVNSLEAVEQWFQKRYAGNFTPKIQNDFECSAVAAIHEVQKYLEQHLTRSFGTSELNPYGETPVLLAARLGNFDEVVSLVEKHGVEQLKNVDKQGNSVWHFAVLTHNTPLKAYLKQKVPELLSIANKYGYIAPDTIFAAHQFFKPAASNVSSPLTEVSPPKELYSV